MQTEGVWRKVVNLPQKLMAIARLQYDHAPNRAAVTAQIAVAIAILVVAPVRLINATVTATQSVSTGMNQSLTVVAFTGAGGIGASVGNSGSRTAPSVVLTTTRAGSFVYGVGNDPIRRAARTPGANQSIVHQWVDTDSNQTFWVQARNGLVPVAGTGVNINSASVNGDWNLVAVEILGR